MARTKYREERTLVRGLHRLRGETREEFKSKVLTLRRHFEQFNLDAADLCQWLMAIRPGGKHFSDESRPVWDFLIGVGEFERDELDDDRDWSRLRVFDIACGVGDGRGTNRNAPPEHVMNPAVAVAQTAPTHSAHRLILRLQSLGPTHRMILLKSATDWVYSRYVRASENQQRHYGLWQKEKSEWEAVHPDLTPEIAQRFNQAFAEIGVRVRSPRVCSWTRLREGHDDCEYAGERVNGRGHSPLCKKYKSFIKQQKMGKEKKAHFLRHLEKYLSARRTANISKQDAMARISETDGHAGWFPKAWDDYLDILGINEETIQRDYGGVLPHCISFDGDCKYNPHTNECVRYREILRQFLDEWLSRESDYREWRRSGFHRAPSKPVFNYPSAKSLPLPKIFGRGYHELGFANSIVRLRLDSMPQGEYLEFAFNPWPGDYEPQPETADITSVHVTFHGTRARLGFRFRVPHAESRFSISQDDIDLLRRVHFPRASQDRAFLTAARNSVIGAFAGKAESEMRLLAVDLGSNEAAASLFVGKTMDRTQPLSIVKMDRILAAWPDDSHSTKGAEVPRKKGLSVDHVQTHLENRAGEAARIAEARTGSAIPELRDHDLRRLTIHIRWMIRDWVRLNASQIIELAEKERIDIILFESLRGFFPPGYDKLDVDKKRRLAFFAYGSVRRKVAEKAVERGMLILTVPYKYSSQICAECGQLQVNTGLWRKNKAKHLFRCESCRREGNSDQNAARVLCKVFWGDIALPAA